MKGKTYRATGGGVEEGVKADDVSPTDVYAGGDSNVVKEARDRSGKFKKGGRVRESEGMDEFEKLEHEGKVKKKAGGCAEGGMSRARADRAPRKGRAAGGPLSTASKTSERPSFKGMKDIND